jgi:stage II sporulation protein M
LAVFFNPQWEYVSKLRPIFALTFLLYIYSIFIGYTLGDQISPQVFEGIFSNIPDPTEVSNIEMFMALAYHNTYAMFIYMASGILLGIPPLMFIAFNGFFVGYISFNAAKIQGLGFVFATILPHGVIEIPALILSSSMGVGLGYQIIHRLMKREGIRNYVADSIKVFIKRIVPLLVLAAGIETALLYYLI